MGSYPTGMASLNILPLFPANFKSEFFEDSSCGVKMILKQSLVLARVLKTRLLEAMGSENPRPVPNPHHRCTMLQS